MRIWITMGMLLAPLLAMGGWSNSAPTSGSAPVTGPGVAAWRQHLAASGTNAHGGLIPTNAPDGVTIVYTGGVLMVPTGTFDTAGSSAAVSNWAAGRFDAAGDHAALSNLGWKASGHTNAPFTFAYFGADNAAYGLTWLEVISDLGPYFDEEGSAAAVSNAAWAQGWVTAGITNGLASTNWVQAQGYLTNATTAGTFDHSALSNLSYAASGHTGFQPAGSYLTSLPGAFTGTAFGVRAGNTNIVFVQHSDFGGGQDLSGEGVWNSGLAQYSGPYVDVRLVGGVWSIGGGGYEYTNSTPSVPVGTYYPSAEGSAGTIQVAYGASIFADSNGVYATHLGGLPASAYATNIAGAARGAMAITNGAGIAAAGGLVSDGSVAVQSNLFWNAANGNKFSMSVINAPFNGTTDSVFHMAYNLTPGTAVTPLNTNEPVVKFQIESDYFDGSIHWTELNYDYVSDAFSRRPLAIGINKANGATYNVFKSTNFDLWTADGLTLLARISDGTIYFEKKVGIGVSSGYAGFECGLNARFNEGLYAVGTYVTNIPPANILNAPWITNGISGTNGYTGWFSGTHSSGSNGVYVAHGTNTAWLLFPAGF